MYKKDIDLEMGICENSNKFKAYELSVENNDNCIKRLYTGRIGFSRLCTDAIVDRTLGPTPIFYINDNTRQYLHIAMKVINNEGSYDSERWSIIKNDDSLSDVTWEEFLDNAVHSRKGIQIIHFTYSLYRTLFIKSDKSMTIIKDSLGKRYIARLIDVYSIKLESKIKRITEKYIVYHYARDNNYIHSSSVIDYKYDDDTLTECLNKDIYDISDDVIIYDLMKSENLCMV